MGKPKVGQTIKGHVIARVWEWPKWWDLDLFNKKTGERGYLRIIKNLLG